MTDSSMTVLVGAIAALITALAAAIPGYLAYHQSLINTKKTDDVIVKTEAIHTLTNSSLSRVQASLETANEKINGLERLIATMTASAVATGVASKESTARVKEAEQRPPPAPPVKSG